MTIRGVDHINIGTDRREETIAFFRATAARGNYSLNDV